MRTEALRARGSVLAFVGLWCVLLLAGRSGMLRDPGTFWHLRVGERVLRSGWPREDWLSFTFGGHPWIAHQWLAECAMAALHAIGGLDALVVATSGALALLLAWLFHRLRTAGVQMLWAALVVALAMLTSSLHFHIRPSTVSILLFAWEYALLVDVDAGRRPLRSLGWLVPVFVVWVNCHGAVLGGVATVGLASAAWVVLRVAGRPSPIAGRRDLVWVLALPVVCAATVLANPYGLETPRVWARIMRSAPLAELIVEHATVFRAGAWQVLVLAIGYVAVLAGAARPLRVTHLLPLVWLVLMLDRVRHAPFFAVAATLALAELLPRSAVTHWMAGRGVAVLESAPPAAVPFLRRSAAALALAVVVTGLVHAGAPGRERLARLDPRCWPVDVIPALRGAAERLGNGAPILNDMGLGGFVAYYAPGLRVFADDRWELYGDDFMRDDARSETAWLDRWAASSGSRVALAERGSRLECYLRAGRGWREVAASTAGVLYWRDSVPDAAAGSASAAP